MGGDCGTWGLYKHRDILITDILSFTLDMYQSYFPKVHHHAIGKKDSMCPKFNPVGGPIQLLAMLNIRARARALTPRITLLKFEASILIMIISKPTPQSYMRLSSLPTIHLLPVDPPQKFSITCRVCHTIPGRHWTSVPSALDLSACQGCLSTLPIRDPSS